ncbi:conserved hypothetical protein [Tenacibaculum litopenaei]|jgi:hypothetical protein|uniref:DUF4834 family protein n=1 Tax=Tenacibaculum litopenaei TaxID=396016 RepID=UPI0038963DB9
MNIQVAGPIAFLKTLLILALIYYVLKFLARTFGPYILKKAVDKAQKQAAQQRAQYEQRDTTVDVGKTVIDRKPNNTKQSNDSVGEYVDFEEIE